MSVFIATTSCGRLADDSREMLGEQFVERHPRPLAFEVPLDAEFLPRDEFALDVLPRRLRGEAERVAAQVRDLASPSVCRGMWKRSR